GFSNGVSGNQVGTAGSPINALLGSLQNNGGPTQTRAPLAGSPALGRGNNTGGPPPHQQGVPPPTPARRHRRPGRNHPPRHSPTDSNNGTAVGTTVTLRDAIFAADAEPAASFILFSISGGAQTIAPTSALPTITQAVTIDGTSQPGQGSQAFLDLGSATALT